jgi:hypothetical protein
MRTARRIHSPWIFLLPIALLRLVAGTPPANIEAQVDSLLAKMTLAEKLGQLQHWIAYRMERTDPNIRI